MPKLEENNSSPSNEPRALSLDGLQDTSVIHHHDNVYELSRSYTAQVPCFFSFAEGQLNIADNYQALLGTLDNNAPDPVWAHDYVSYQCPLTHRTPCDGIYHLRAGETAHVSPKGSAFSYTKPHVGPIPEHAVLSTALEKEIANLEIENTAFHISAGLDSSLLAILATKHFKGHAPSVHSFRALGRGASDELEMVQRLADDYSLDLVIHDFTDIDIFKCGTSMMSALDFPLAHPSQLSRYLLDREITKTGKIKTIVTGRGADETMGGYLWHQPGFRNEKHHDRVRATSPEIANSLIPLAKGGSAHSNYEAFFTQYGYSLSGRKAYDLLTLFSDWNVIDASLARALGIDYRNPFAHQSLMEALLPLDEMHCINGKEQKIFLRTAFAETYPEYLLSQNKKGLSLDISAYLQQYEHAEIYKTIYKESPFCRRFINHDLFTNMLDQVLQGTSNYGWQIWNIYLISLEYSLRYSSQSENAGTIRTE